MIISIQILGKKLWPQREIPNGGNPIEDPDKPPRRAKSRDTPLLPRSVEIVTSKTTPNPGSLGPPKATVTQPVVGHPATNPSQERNPPHGEDNNHPWWLPLSLRDALPEADREVPAGRERFPGRGKTTHRRGDTAARSEINLDLLRNTILAFTLFEPGRTNFHPRLPPPRSHRSKPSASSPKPRATVPNQPVARTTEHPT